MFMVQMVQDILTLVQINRWQILVLIFSQKELVTNAQPVTGPKFNGLDPLRTEE